MTGSKYIDFYLLLRNQNRTRDVIRRIQDEKLVRLTRHAYENVPMYRDLFRNAGIGPEGIRSVEDLVKIPVVDKRDFIRRGESERLDRRISDRSRLIPVHTSGSSGFPLRFFIDRGYDEFRKAQYLRPYWINGLRPTDRLMRITSRERPGRKWFERLGLMREYRFGVSSEIETQIEFINGIKPSVIQGYPSSLNLLASRILELGVDVHLPRIVFTDSELLIPEWRNRIEAVFGCRVVDIYGTYETDNIAYECGMHTGYHIASDCVIMEFVGTENTSGPREEGRIVCTVLDNFTNPFIRYDLGDVGMPSFGNCACGSPFPLMKVIEGRADDFVVFPGGIKKPALPYLGGMKKFSGNILEYQIVQMEVNRFEVHLVPGRAYGREVGQRIKEILQKVFPNAAVDILPVSSIDRGPSKKLRAFVSKIGCKSGMV